MLIKYLPFVFVCLIVGKLSAQISFPNTLQAIKVDENITLDGKLNEAVWTRANRISNFTQRELNFNEPATERTEVSIAYNEKFLYIAVWCYDSNPGAIIAKELRRDFSYDIDDNIIIIIDTYNDKRNGFMFVTNPNGARADLQVFNNGGSTNLFWNGVWNVKTTRTNEGWFAEFEIPLYTFKYKNTDEEQNWGLNVERNIRHKREQVCWQGWSRNNRITQVNQAGTILGLKNLSQNTFIEIKPYTIGGNQVNTRMTNNNQPNWIRNNPVLNAGGDINTLLSPTYRLNLTFNTDFAQVESDQQQINLTRFQLNFPELREYFLEGDDFFNMGFGGNRIIPFYTRRIGSGIGDTTNVPIIAGARLLGKEQNSTIGLMSIQTDRLQGNPLTNYTVGSIRQDVGKQSVIGAMTVNKITNQYWHSTTGVNGRYSTSKFLGNKNLDIGGAFIQTYNSDSGFQQKSYAYRMFVAYLNDKWNVFASTQKSPVNFNPEVGLMTRENFNEYFAEVAYKPRPKNRLKWIRQFEFIPVMITQTNYDETNAMQSFTYSLQFLGFDTRKGESFRMSYNRRGEGLINTFKLLRIIPIETGNYYWDEWCVDIRTFRGRTLSFSNRLSWGELYDGHSLQNRLDMLWRAGKYLNMSVRYEYNDLNLPNGSLITHLVGTRMEYAINPNAFGSVLSQWNSLQNQWDLNFRLHVIPRIGTDFFFIVNQVLDTNNERLTLKRMAILGKLVWRFTV